MFGLLYGLWRQLSSKPCYYVLIAGLDGAGKTTFLEKAKGQYMNQKALDPHQIQPTVGLNSTFGVYDHAEALLTFWDLGGKADLRSIWEKYYAEAHAVVFVVDATDPDRSLEVSQTIDKLMREQQLVQVPFLVLLNKQDAVAQGQGRSVHWESLLPLAGSAGNRPCKILTCSAKNGKGVREALEWVLYEVINHPSRKPVSRTTDE